MTSRTRPLRVAVGLAAALVVPALLLAPVALAIPLRNLELKANKNDYPIPNDWGYSACWGYVHPDGREYAVIGTRNGTAIYNVTDPNNVTFVKLIPGLSSAWREMKSYRTWIYVVTENGTAAGGIQPGLQIIRMTDPDNPVLAATYDINFNRSHTVSVDTTRAVLLCNGTNYRDPGTGLSSARGMRVLSLASPEAPVELTSWPAAGLQSNSSYYVHDCVPVGNRLYASSIYVGIQRIFDFTDPAAVTEIKNWTYPGAYYCHSAWPDAGRDHLYVCDEQNGQTMRVFDISTETAPVLVNEWTSNPQAIVHNPLVNGTDLWLANYTEGIRVLDISNPDLPAEWGYADSYPGASGGYNGVWAVYPFFPSGTIIASDMNTGLYVYRPVRDYGVVYAHVTDGVDPVSGATVTVQETADSARTSSPLYAAAFAPNPGTYTITARKFGYAPASASVTLAAGEHKSIDLALTVLPTVAYSGTVIDAVTSQPLAGAEVNLRWTPIHQHTDALGTFDLGDIPVDHYRVDVRRPGYVPMSFERDFSLPPTFQTFALTPAALYDPLTTDQGWTVGGASTGDNASTGVWVRVEPLGTSIGGTQPVLAARAGADPLGALGLGRPLPGALHEGGEGEGANPGQVQPEYDRSPPPDSLCWVTGQGTSPTSIDEADVDGPGGPGKTTLTSPAYDVTGMAQPTIGYWRWFYTQFGSPDDWLATLISNDDGANWTPVDTLRGLDNHWEEEAVTVSDYVTPTNHVRLRFVAADFGYPTVVEAGIDDISVYDATAGAVTVPHSSGSSRLGLRAPRPNPARGSVTLAVEVPRTGALDVEVMDLAGRRVATLYRGRAAAGTLPLRWDGSDGAGRSAPAGLYFLRARLDGEVTETRIARVR